MGDPICKWRAARPHNVVELVNDILPHTSMSEEMFRQKVESIMPGFMHTPYQLACQLGLYAIVDGVYYPRFTKDITDDEALSYLEDIVSKYYVPNPYTPRGFKNLESPILLEASIVEYLEKYPHQDDIEFILRTLLKEEVGNLTATKTLLSYSKLFTISGSKITLNSNYKALMNVANSRNDKKAFFDFLQSQMQEHDINLPIQQIYFGAPGTGKSHEIKKEVKKHKSFRITFHPDTDYSSFVGAYKPTSIQVPMLTTLGDKAIPMKDEHGNPLTENKIIYTYVKQAFLNAYIEAWKEQENETPKPVFLVIEEINRGNCAQIFGDIFQLLDRNEANFSDYSVVPDTDLSRHVKADLENLDIANRDKINAIYEDCETDMVGKVLNGDVLLLPNNLYIWATMNTSDQSLFPIDSAFKRRWDWKYIKIADAHKGWQIKVGTKSYDWWQFVQAINYFVFDATQSEDKNLGYFFAKAKDDAISAETFVSKVIFYLYTDVFKDYGFSGDIFKGLNDEEITFQSFYNADGSPCNAQIIRFIENVIYSEALPEQLKVGKPTDDEDMNVYDEDELDDNTSNSSSARHKVSVGDTQCSLRRTFFEITRQAIKANPSMTLSDLITISNMCDFVPPQRNNLFLEASKIAQWQEDHADDNTSKDRYYFKLSDYLTDTNGLQFVVYAQWSKTPQVADALIKYAENLNVNVELI